MEKVLDLMSANPVTVPLNAALGECARLLIDNRLRHLIAVDSGGELAGVVTDFALFEHGDYSKRDGWSSRNYQGADKAKDIVVDAAVSASAGDAVVPTLIGLAKSLQDFVVVTDSTGHPVGFITEHLAIEEASERLPKGLRVDQYSTKHVISVDADAEASAAWTLMRSHQIRHVLVTKGGELAGVISYRDILERDAEHGSGVTAGSVASTAIETITGGESIAAAARTMARQRIGCLPVVEGGELQGIITRTDVLIALVGELAG